MRFLALLPCWSLMVALHIDTQIKQHTNHFLCAKPTIGIDPAKYWLPVVALHKCTDNWICPLKEYIYRKMKLTLPSIGCQWLPFTRIHGHTNTKTNKNTNHFLCAKPTIGIDPAKYWLPVVALHMDHHPSKWSLGGRSCGGGSWPPQPSLCIYGCILQIQIHKDKSKVVLNSGNCIWGCSH